MITGTFARAALLAVLCLSAVRGPATAQTPADGNDGTGFAGAYAPSKYWQPPRDPQALAKLRKFQDLKFGFFYCWGTQTQWGSTDQSWPLCPERYPWNQRPAPYENADTLTFKKAYEELIRTFNPIKFDPKAVADLAEAAGTRYLVFCTKHHDGFCFWDTKTTDYRITSPSCPFHTNANADVTRVLFDAFRSKGFWIGVYFSKPDWHTPYYWAPQFGPPTSRSQNYSTKEHPEIWQKFKDLTWAQIRELMSGYGPVDLLWLDGGQVQPRNGQDINMPGIARMARELQPGLLVVDRTAGGGCEDFLTPEGVHAMPDKFRPEAWEACMTLGDRWGWTRDSAYKSSGSIIRYLARAVARNGNLLLDVGPDASGELNPEAAARLREIGAWLKVNGEAIYDTRPVKPYEMGNCFFTRKPDGTTYAIVLSTRDGEPPPKEVVLPGELATGAADITLVGHGAAPLAVRAGSNGTTIVEFPAAAIARPPCADAWALRLAAAQSQGAK